MDIQTQIAALIAFEFKSETDSSINMLEHWETLTDDERQNYVTVSQVLTGTDEGIRVRSTEYINAYLMRYGVMKSKVINFGTLQDKCEMEGLTLNELEERIIELGEIFYFEQSNNMMGPVWAPKANLDPSMQPIKEHFDRVIEMAGFDDFTGLVDAIEHEDPSVNPDNFVGLLSEIAQSSNLLGDIVQLEVRVPNESRVLSWYHTDSRWVYVTNEYQLIQFVDRFMADLSQSEGAETENGELENEG